MTDIGSDDFYYMGVSILLVSYKKDVAEKETKFNIIMNY
jgi:hypothetical protein